MPGDLLTVFIVMLNCPPWNMAPLKGSDAGNIEVFINEASALVVIAAVHEALSLHHSQHCMLKALSSVSMIYSSVALKKQSCSCLHFANYNDVSGGNIAVIKFLYHHFSCTVVHELWLLIQNSFLCIYHVCKLLPLEVVPL